MQIGQSVGAYEVIAKLGEGGMGEVYRARDTRLDREVALKVLPGDMVADSARLERFAREARALAALNHPHIVTIFSTEEADGIRFLTMELVEGKSLDRVVPQSGLPLAQLLEIAVPLCDAIAAAHDKHLTHRDLKPANVMVSDAGRVKVLDFGLASFGKSEPHQPDVTRMELTHQGTVLGTAPYMSPEQVEGKPLDHRTDIFSLGIMLYEMAAGRRPFKGDSSPALMSSILKDTPTALRDIRADLPIEFARIVTRCLEKDPRDRIQTARDVFNDLTLLRRELTSDSGSRVVQRPRVRISTAVAPFTAPGADEITGALAGALVEDIASGLGRFSYLSLVADPSAARYVVSGSIRRAGNALRVSAHLLDRDHGTQIWTETYNRQATEDIFALQDDLSTRIASTVADAHGVLIRSMAATLTDRPYDQLTATELLLRYHVYLEQFRPAEHARLREAFEHVLTREPHHADAWASLSRLYEHEYSHGLNPQPESQERQRKAAERAVEVNPICQAGWEAMASVHFFGRDRAALRDAVDRVIALNPLSGSALGFMGMVLSWSGDWDRGVEIIRRVMEYNPHHAGWYFFVTATNFYRLGRFEESLSESKRVNMPHLPWTHVGTAVAAGQLGRRTDAQLAIEGIRRTLPAMLDLDFARAAWSGWFWENDFVELHVAGLRKALALVETPLDSLSRQVAQVPSAAKPTPSAVASEPSPTSPSAVERAKPRSDAGRLKLTTVVAPFTVQGQDGDAVNVADGLSEEVTTGLAKFDYLSVISDATQARYLVGGSVRQLGKAIRIGARLIDSETGARLWNETYTRDLNAVDAFALVDDVTDRIVATVGDAHGALLRSMAHGIRDRLLEDLNPRELALAFWAYDRQHTATEHARLRAAFAPAVEQWPNDAGLWAIVAHLCAHEHAFGFNGEPDAIARTLQAARRALDLDPANQHAWHALAVAYLFQHDHSAFLDAVDRALAINPRNANTLAWLATLLGHHGDDDRAVEMVARATAINPHHPGWYLFPVFGRHFNRQEYAEALQVAKRINMPDHLWFWVAIAAAAARAGVRDDAVTAIEKLRAIAPAVLSADAMRALSARWQSNGARRDALVAAFDHALQLAQAADPDARTS